MSEDSKNKWFLKACVIFLGTASSSVYAADTDVVLNLEGNPTCSSLVVNTISEARDTSPPDDGIVETLILENGIELNYSISNGDTISQFYIADPGPGIPVKPVNFVILKGAGNAGARVFHYGEKGLVADSNLEGPGTIKTVSFCYGLNDVILDAPNVTDRCEQLDGGELDGVKIECPADGSAHSVHSIRKGDRLIYSECTCNEDAVACDDTLPAGAVGACIPKCPTVLDQYPYSFGGITYNSIEECLEDSALKETPAGTIRPWNTGSGWCGSGMLGTSGCYRW